MTFRRHDPAWRCLTRSWLAEHPLAENIPLENGAVNVTVPSVTARDDYIVVCAFLPLPPGTRLASLLTVCFAVFGDSGNKSPKFTIH